MVFFSNGPLHATIAEMLLRVGLVPLGIVLVTVAFFPLPMWASDLHGCPRVMISMGMHQGNPNYLTIIKGGPSEFYFFGLLKSEH